ncbi:MAG: ATP-binding protein [Actinomycetota bacterium]|nr:ATP-binding protein [Actinomycetota bacterium]
MSRLQQAHKATKQALKARIALAAPAGGGKTYTALTMARVLADGGQILVIDTERDSASLYADLFDFDSLPWDPPFDPRELAAAVVEAGEKYAVVIVDSLSHFWMGEGGTLSVVDAAGARAKGNSYAGWKEGTPAQNDMIEGLLRTRAHVIATMRSKSEYVLEQGSNGKTVPRRIGMAPVQRDGIEFEFTVTAELDYEHNIIVDKTRCHLLAGRMFSGPKAEEMTLLLKGWLNDGEPPADRVMVEELVARMNALDEEQRKACKAAFVATFGRPEQLLARSLADAAALISKFEDDPTTPPATAATTPNQGDGSDGAATEGTAGQAAAAVPEEAPAQTMPAGDAPASAAASPPPEDQAAAAAPPADGPTFLERLGDLPADLAVSVRQGEVAVRARGVVPKSQEHVDETVKLLDDAEKAQIKRAQQVVLSINAGATANWHRLATDDERHQLLHAFTGGAVSSAKKVTGEQLKALRRQIRDWQNGAVFVDATLDGGYLLRESVAS